MKLVFAITITLTLLFSGCSFIELSTDNSAQSALEAPSKPTESKESEKPEASSAPEAKAPDKVAKELMDEINTLDEDKVRELADIYFAGQPFSDSYYKLLKPISERMTYKIKDYKIDGDKAAVNLSVTSVDAQSAINDILPGAGAHLVAMQITGKDVSKPEEIFAEYAAKNVKWDELPTVTKDATLHLVKGDDGEWQVDADNPDNYGFLNAICGGGLEAVENLKNLVERFK